MASSRNKKDSSLPVLKWILKKSKARLLAVFIIALLAALVSVSFIVLALVSKQILDIATGDSGGSLLYYGTVLLLIVIFQIILSGAEHILKVYTEGKLTITFRNHLFNAVSRKKYATLSAYHSGELLNLFTSDTDVVVKGLVDIIPNVMSILAKLVSGIAALFILDKRIALIVLVLGVTVPALGRIISKTYKQLHKKCQETEGNTRSFLQEFFENIVVVKAFVSEKLFYNKLNEYLNTNFKVKMKRGYISTVISLLLYTFFTLGYYGILLWGAGSIAEGMMTYGTLMAFLQLIQQLRAPLQNVSGILPQYYSAIASAERLIALEEGQTDKPANTKETEKLSKVFSRIDAKNITFGYDKEKIIENCSFSIEKGRITAVTGESGSGKSTIFKLLLGLYEVEEGSITINGEIPLTTAHRGLFAYVPQGNMVLSGTIRENVTMCNEKVSKKEIERALRAAEVYDVIAELPEGLETHLTERGGGLSEGQLQRIAIARALLTKAPVILLDEATSALDEENETKLLANIKAMNDKAVLFVTHRNTSLSVCDKIIYVKEKKFEIIKE